MQNAMGKCVLRKLSCFLPNVMPREAARSVQFRFGSVVPSKQPDTVFWLFGQVKGKWHVCVSANPHSMNKAQRREYQGPSFAAPCFASCAQNSYLIGIMRLLFLQLWLQTVLKQRRCITYCQESFDVLQYQPPTQVGGIDSLRSACTLKPWLTSCRFVGFCTSVLSRLWIWLQNVWVLEVWKSRDHSAIFTSRTLASFPSVSRRR